MGILTDTLFDGPAGVGQGLATVYALCSAIAVVILLVGAAAYRRAAQAAKAWAQ